VGAVLLDIRFQNVPDPGSIIDIELQDSDVTTLCPDVLGGAFGTVSIFDAVNNQVESGLPQFEGDRTANAAA
jgi:hypothetical protein